MDASPPVRFARVGGYNPRAMRSESPLLVVTAGPARGGSVPLTGMIPIGRDRENALAIGDPALSRRHCVVEASGANVVIRDLGSRNGVFVNGCPVTERRLVDGDQIRIGDSALLVVIPGTSGGEPRPLFVLDERHMDATGTLSIAPEDSAYIVAETAGGLAPNRAMHDLHRLIELSVALQMTTTVEAVHTIVLGHVVEAFPGCGGVVLTRSGNDAFAAVAALNSSGQQASVSSAVAARALDQRVAVLATDVPSLAVPLGSDADAGVLCVIPHATGSLTDDDLQLAAAIGLIGGLARDRAAHIEWLQRETARLRNDAAIEHSLVGESEPMQRVLRFITRVAATDATVLLRGESGTGKELIAHAIHANSARAKGPFVAINCAALPDALLESELFGHERGAFTGAIAQQRGRLELADKGTVFLDEIGELATPLQAKLLRVLQDQIVERVGARRGIKIDARVIAATNLDLEQALAAGAFRQDLYYRLNVVSLIVPPLRERRADVPLLAAYFVRKHAARCKRVVRGISPAARSLLMQYDWPGNVRELSNALERAVVLGSGDVIVPEDLPEALLDAASTEESPRGYHARVAASKKAILAEALDQHDGNVAGAARALDLQATYLHRLIRTLGVRQQKS